MIRDGTVGVGLLALLALLMVVVGAQTIAAADAVVGTGTPESCTEAAFDSALATAQSGGGTVTFNCGGPATIGFTTPKHISADVAIIASAPITLSGGGQTRLFVINANGTATLEGLTLRDGISENFTAAIDNRGHLTMNTITITHNLVDVSIERFIGNSGVMTITNSAIRDNIEQGKYSSYIDIIYNTGRLSIYNSVIANNTSSAGGSRLILNEGWMFITGTTFEDNHLIEGFTIINASDLIIEGSTFRSNHTEYSGGAINSSGPLTITGSLFENNSALYGGAILNSHALFIADSVFRYNGSLQALGGAIVFEQHANYWEDFIIISSTDFLSNTAAQGGALYLINDAMVNIRDQSVLAGNRAYQGGAIYSERVNNIRVYDSTVRENTLFPSTMAQGGGIYASDSSIDIFNSAIISNSATITGTGGGIYTTYSNRAQQRPNVPATSHDIELPPHTDGQPGGPSFVINSTISGNIGSGLHFQSLAVTVTHSTIANNQGVGLFNGSDLDFFFVENNIIAGNSASACAGVAFTTLFHTIADDQSCAAQSEIGNQPNTDPQLAPLALLDNTLAHMPAATSPAIDAAACHIHVSHDQRRLARPQGWNCDLGAIETTIIKERIFLPAILR